MKRLKKFLLEFFLVFKAPQGIHGFEDIVIDEVVSWNDVSLDHLHHWSLQLELTFTPSSNPGMSVDFLQLKKKGLNKKTFKKIAWICSPSIDIPGSLLGVKASLSWRLQ